MQSTWKLTEADRDGEGKIKLQNSVPTEPRSLAELLPTPEDIRKDAARTPQKMTRTEIATLAAVALMAAFVVVYAWATPNAPTAPPQASPTTIATVQPTDVPTTEPTALPAALVGYFDYRDPDSAAPIAANQIMRVIGMAGERWRLVDVGDARVWIAAEQVPAGTPAVEPLPDLAPRPTAPARIVQPVSAPIEPTAVPCSRENASFLVHRQVFDGTAPVGEVNGWSCISQAAAERAADEQEAQMRAGH